MDIKRGLIRVWIVGSVVWAVYIPLFFIGVAPPYAPMPPRIADLIYQDSLAIVASCADSGWCIAFTIIPIAATWAALYIGFWVASGFKDKQ